MKDNAIKKELLTSFLSLSKGFKESTSPVLNLNWDSEEHLVVFTKNDAIHVLNLFLQGLVDDNQVRAWARIIESRDDIEYESSNESLLREFIFNLATPDINGEITGNKARLWISKLDTCEG